MKSVSDKTIWQNVQVYVDALATVVKINGMCVCMCDVCTYMEVQVV